MPARHASAPPLRVGFPLGALLSGRAKADARRRFHVFRPCQRADVMQRHARLLSCVTARDGGAGRLLPGRFARHGPVSPPVRAARIRDTRIDVSPDTYRNVGSGWTKGLLVFAHRQSAIAMADCPKAAGTPRKMSQPIHVSVSNSKRLQARNGDMAVRGLPPERHPPRRAATSREKARGTYRLRR